MTTTLIREISGAGLITGQTSTVKLEAMTEGHGVVFVVGGVEIPARPEFVVNQDRGVTLGRDGQMLAIVEHFLSAVAMTGRINLRVTVSGAPELPLLDGSSTEWVSVLETLPEVQMPQAITLASPVVYRDPVNPSIELWAIPDGHLSIAYLVDFPHPLLAKRWFQYDSVTDNLLADIAPARTFGLSRELPALQSRGLALGVTVENTLGLNDDGTTTSSLRMADEPIRHKILDLIGDLMLCGIPAPVLQAKIIVHWGGHAAHLAFGKRLSEALQA